MTRIIIPNPSKADTVTLYDMDDFAGSAGITVATLGYHIRAGHLMPIKIGRKYMFTYETLLAFCASRRKPGRPSAEPTVREQLAHVDTVIANKPEIPDSEDVPTDLVTCPFCTNSHPVDTLCGCPQESETAAQISDRIDHSDRLSNHAESWYKWYRAFS